MKKIYIAIGILLVSLTTIYFIFNKPLTQKQNLSNIDSNEIIKKGEDRDQQPDTISYGLKDEHGNHIDNGSSIDSNDSNVNVFLSLNHNIDEERKYGLIILEDYQQKSFKIKEDETSKYIFDMKPNSSINTEISLNISPNAKELTFLLVKKPEYKLKDNDMKKASILEEVLSMRYSINKNNKKEEIEEIEMIQPKTILKDGLNEPLFITKNEEKLQAVFSETEGKELSISNGNETNKDMKYVIVAFRDWEQIEILDNKKVIYTTVAPETRQIFNFTLPKTEQESNFQLVALPFPNEVSKDNYESQKAFGSIRIVVENEE